jgi:hypothetical protein
VGRFIGEKIGAAVGKETEDKTAAAQAIPAANVPSAIRGYSPYSPAPQNMKVDGQVGLGVDVSLHDNRTTVSTYLNGNSAPAWLNTGNAPRARVYN